MPITYNEILSNAADYAGAGSNIASSVFDFINSGTDTGVYSAGLVRDINTDGFLASNPLHKPDYFVRAFDEPTYLTFKIEFLFHQDRNALYSNNAVQDNTEWTLSNRVTYDKAYDFLPEAFLEDGMLTQNDNFATNRTATGDSLSYTPMTFQYNHATGMLNRTKTDFIGYYYSAEDYLGINRGEYGRARLMRKIKVILKDITENFPYYFKSIEGLDKLNLINPKAGYRLADDVVLTIKCYEGLDLKITQLIQMIRKVTWDDMYQRWVLPDIMRYFGMRIYVSEIRTFHEMAKKDLAGLRQKQKLTTFDYRADKNGELRNATEMTAAKTWFAKIMNFTSGILTAATALGNTYFGGTGFANAVNAVGSTVSTISDITGSINQIYQVMCISALNEVMPTICYECHMCEFDILDNMSEMGTLSSTSGDPQEQVIRIKVRQVEDFQVYPLDRNLTVSRDGNNYAILNRLYGKYRDAGDDDSTYEQMRAEGITGSTVFADQIFNERGSDLMRSMYDSAADDGYGVNQTKLYRNLASYYDYQLNNFFVNIGFNKIGKEDGEGISPRSKMYPGKASIEKMHNDKGALAYKRNSLDTSENIMKLLVGGLNAANSITGGMSIYDNNFSRATGVSYDDFERKLPELYVAAKTLQDTMRRMEKDNLDDTELGRFELLNKLAYSKATKYTPIGQVASAALENVDNPWRDINAYEERDVDANGQPIMSTVHVNRNWSTIAQDPRHNRHGNTPIPTNPTPAQ